ncbi:MAG: cell envelope integrity protein TolA [Kiloniellaceae bacterium]
MRNGTVLSTILHGAVIGVLIVGLPRTVTPLNQTIVPIELVVFEDADVAEPAPEPEPEPKAEAPAPEPEPPQQEAKTTAEPPPPPPVPEVLPEPEPEPAPPPPPEPEPEPVVEAPPPEPEPKPEPAPPPPIAKPAPEPEPAPKPAPPVPRRRPVIRMAAPKAEEAPKPKPKLDQLAAILRNVDKMREAPKPRVKKDAKAPETGPPKPQVSVFERNDMVRAIQQQLRRCWRLDPGALKAEDMVVEIRVLLNPDGSVRRTDILDVARMVQDGHFRSAAENAKRAIDMCSPFRLPPRKYDIWRELTLRFNPREMFGT